jgi:hypothetical protein
LQQLIYALKLKIDFFQTEDLGVKFHPTNSTTVQGRLGDSKERKRKEKKKGKKGV